MKDWVDGFCKTKNIFIKNMGDGWWASNYIG